MKTKKYSRDILSFNLDADVSGMVNSLPRGCKSNIVNRALREWFKIHYADSNMLSNEEVESMSSVKAKYLDEILQYVSSCKYIHRAMLSDEIEVRIGITQKRANEYIDLLLRVGKIKKSGQYIIDSEYNPPGPAPGTDEWFRERASSETKTNANAGIESVREDCAAIDIICENKQETHTHAGSVFKCRACGKDICAECASSFISGDKNGLCRECG